MERKMRKVCAAFALIFVLSGCAYFREQKDNFAACMSDPACRQMALDKSKNNGEVAGQIASLSGVPAAGPIAKSAVSYLSLIIFLCAFGAALRKKEVKNA